MSESVSLRNQISESCGETAGHTFLFLYNRNTMKGAPTFYGELGFKPGYCVPANLMNIEFSPDKYPDLGTDHLLIQRRFYFPEDEKMFRSIQQTEAWRSIRAVKQKHVYYNDNWFGMSWSAPGRVRIIEDLLAL
ncbi:TroA family protein [Paenibacillus senegalensis]|uniref:transcriptional regulator n=1 Tax=Paenibacillus senegalensis TaxID=1465766 RepID=UPI000289C856|nr:transcriptional regulator [Paenibacillus senegalensis]